MTPRRVRYRPRFSLLGLVSGVLGALGSLVFLQQAGKVYPTAAVGIITLVLGLVTGLVLPSIGRLVANRRVNRRLARLTASAPVTSDPSGRSPRGADAPPA